MKKHITYFFSLLFLIPFTGYSQDSSRQIITGIGAGIDLSKAAIQFMEENRSIYAASLDVRIRRNYYFELISGMQQLEINKDFYDYSSSGWFGKAGIKHNFLKTIDPEDQSIAFFGFRFAYAAFNQDANNIKFLYNYWGDPVSDFPKESLTALWVELGGGIHTEVIRNVLIGASVYGRIMISKPEEEYMPAKNIPGFGEPNRNFNFGFEYWLKYRIPFIKKSR